MSEELPRIEDGLFIWECDNGHVTDTPVASLVLSVRLQEKTVCMCHNSECDRVFEISDEFAEKIKQAPINSDLPDE